YHPAHLPGRVRYRFDWVKADVLGSAYEKYLGTVLREGPPVQQIQLLGDQVIREPAQVSVRRAQGVFYTPRFLVEYLVERAIENHGPFTHVDDLPTAIDFACGSGSFLVAFLDALVQRLREEDPDRNWAREIVAANKV